MFDSLFGAELPLAVRFFIAFVIVLLLIGVTFWLIRRFGAERLGTGQARGRQPRLAVIDATAVDGRRRLVLIRRDNVEHLVMIGGPSDIVVEQNIVRAVPVSSAREMQGRGPALDSFPRGQDRAETGPRQASAAEELPWIGAREPDQSMRHATRSTDGDYVEFEPARPPRPQPQDEIRRAPSVPEAERPRGPRPIEAVRKDAAPIVRPVEHPMDEPLPMPIAPASDAPHKQPEPTTPELRASPPTADTNLADMAQRLEAALRRPIAPDKKAESPAKPAAVKPAAPEAVRPPASTVPTDLPMPRISADPAKREPARPQAPEPPRTVAPAPKPARPEPKPAQPMSVFDSLEQEMASLLGRPKSKE